jgi:hypothetical protein
MPDTRNTYGQKWSADVHQIDIEFYNIRKGAAWLKERGRTLFQHFQAAQRILWPTDDEHRWSELGLRSMCENDITVFMGAGDTNKTYTMCRYILVDWWADPERTLWLISSTEYRGAELRIWGKIKECYNRAQDQYEKLTGNHLPGKVLESMHAITTDVIDDDKKFARSLQKGLIFVPCKKGNQYVGLSAFIGVKSPRLRHAGDEVQHMSEGFLDAYANWYGKRDFKGVMAGNPTDVEDPLCKAAEPLEGWDNFVDTGKTQTWRSKFFDAHVVAFDGRDSPNDDFNTDTPKYHYLISKKKRDAVARTFGEDSWQFANQCIGKPNRLLVANRVITRTLCEQNRALDSVSWLSDDNHTLIYGLDPAWGGQDRCVGILLEIGTDIENNQVVRVYEPELVPVSIKLPKDPEYQIAAFLAKRLRDLGVPIENCFYDSFGRGTLGHALAFEFGSNTPIPIDSGGKPSDRPVRFDLWTEENGKRRLVKSSEYYSKRVSEMWYSVREAIEGKQIRELPHSVMMEGCQRTFRIVKGNKIEVEPKEDMIARLGRSPDLFDALAIGIEGARQRGFKIKRIGDKTVSPQSSIWFTKQYEKTQSFLKSRQLVDV